MVKPACDQSMAREESKIPDHGTNRNGWNGCWCRVIVGVGVTVGVGVGVTVGVGVGVGVGLQLV